MQMLVHFYGVLALLALLLTGDMKSSIYQNIFTIAPNLFHQIFGFVIGMIYLPLIALVRRHAPESANQRADRLAQSPENETGSEAGNSFRFTSDEATQMRLVIQNVMTLGESYLQPRYSLSDLAKDTHIPVHHLSAFINKYYKMNFNDFLNLHRIEHFKKRILSDKSWQSLTLEAMARQSGFGNRTTFTLAFKKFNGITPTQFLRLPKTEDDTPMNPEDQKGIVA